MSAARASLVRPSRRWPLARAAGDPGGAFLQAGDPYDATMQNYLLTTLDSGTRVITSRSSVRSVAIGFWIGTGSRDEDDTHAGVSHFIEHLLFKGTDSYSALEIAEIFDRFGGELNAATARDYTVVYARVLDEHLETALDVMTDMVFAPAFADIEPSGTSSWRRSPWSRTRRRSSSSTW